MTGEQDQAAEKDWGNLRFRPRRSRYAEGAPEDNANARFVIGLAVFVFVALAYPWYSYWVQTRLLAHELREATTEMSAQARRVLKAASDRMQQQVAQSRAAAVHRSVRGVRVMGAMRTSSGPVVIVDLGEAGLAEGSPAICRQASAWLGSSTSGQRLRVQAYRGRAPAETIGSVDC
jgi:hypothetical protein